jgi:long-chain acyl-CoA synthetase
MEHRGRNGSKAGALEDGKSMRETLKAKSGWEIREEEWPDFKGRIFKTRPRNIVELLENTVATYPDKVGFISEDRRLTFKEFDGTVNRIAAGLAKHGVKRGDHVALLLGVQLEFPLSFFALMKLGAMVVPLNTRFKGEELAYEINDSESTLLIVDEEFWPHIDSVRGELKTVEKIFFTGRDLPEGALPFSLLKECKEEVFPRAALSESDDAAIMYTSGTTGKPKGAVLHQRGIVLTAMLVSDFVQFRPEDRMMCCIPLFHITGLTCLMLPPIFSGVACVYMRQFKTKEFLEIMAKEKVTQYMGVINVIWLMINHPDFEKYDFSFFRTALFGGSPATEEMVRGIFSKLPHIQISVGYGLTECFAITTSTPFEDALRKIKAVGKCLPTVDVKIVDDEGREVRAGSIGEILLGGAKVFKGYWKRPEATRETIVEGWVRTGDIGKVDEEGFVYVLDRKKDMINRGGEKIYSLEVENVICDNPKILEVAVVGVPDKVMGEVVKACIALKPGEKATEAEIKTFCAERLADYKVPKFVEFMESLPRNPAGKVSKPELRNVPGKAGK